MKHDLKEKEIVRGGRRLQTEKPARQGESQERAAQAVQMAAKEAAKHVVSVAQDVWTGVRVAMRRGLRPVRKNVLRARRRWRHIVREVRRHNFPESDRLPIQMVLFSCTSAAVRRCARRLPASPRWRSAAAGTLSSS